MSVIRFTAAELQSNGQIEKANYQFVPKGDGWSILREGKLYLSLGSGYVPLEVLACGVCATDLARLYLPFPFPQICGHELLAQHENRRVVVDINAHPRALGTDDCLWCASHLANHSPDRMTIGIDRLPGGFGPWILAPQGSLYDVPEEISDGVATLMEPLAATLQSLRVTRPRSGQRVAVLGPRRLGMLQIAALAAWREKHQIDFEITALARRAGMLALAGFLGADMGVNLPEVDAGATKGYYDIVFDTTGSPEGFLSALEMAKGVVHLKSTHGRPVVGLYHLSEMVVAEIALLPLTEDHISFKWPEEQRSNLRILVTPDFRGKLPQGPSYEYHHMNPVAAYKTLHQDFWDGLPCFDIAVVGSIEEIDAVLKPAKGAPPLVRPRGAVLLESQQDNPLAAAVCKRGLQIHTSRCGPLQEAIKMVSADAALCDTLEHDLITHRVRSGGVKEALKLAEGRDAVKVVLQHAHQSRNATRAKQSII